MRVFLTGASGFIGRALASALEARGDQVVAVSRDVDRARRRLGAKVELVAGDPCFSGDWQAALAGTDAVVNLAGQPIAGKRWNAQYRQILHDSRVDATRYLVEAIAATTPADRPRVLISASGIDYYPFSDDLGLELEDDDVVVEGSPRGDSALARICRDWEAEATGARKAGLRVVLMRMGVILGGGGGALAALARPFKLLVGGRLGSGRQWVSWVHLDDVIAAYLFALDRSGISGPLNLVAPQPVRNRELARSMGRAMHRPAAVPMPAFALRAAVGEFSEYLLHGRRAVPAALERHGFQFRFPDLDSALADLLS